MSAHRCFALLGLAFITLLASGARAQNAAPDRDTPSCTLQLRIEGPIGPGSLDYLEHGFREAESKRCRSILLLVNTPGGALSTTRLMVEKILASPIPVLCLVHPSGGHAGSAGAILLMACHVSGASPATNIGAATPVSGSGQEMGKDLRAKMLEDTVSWVKGLAKLRGRNVELSGKVVSEARALDAESAAKEKLLDTVQPDVQRFLDFAEGRDVAMSGDSRAAVRTGALAIYEPDLRSRFLQIIANPEFAYLLFMASLALLYFEFTHAGATMPGVVGGIGLIISLVAFHYLDIRWAGAALIVLGLAFMVAEAYLPTHGALGVGGIASFIVGSIFLYERLPGQPALSPWLIGGTTLVFGGAMLGIAVLAFRAHRRGPALNETALLGQTGEVASVESPSLRKGMINVDGEFWRFKCESDLQPGARVQVVAQDGLTLVVKRKD